MNKGKVADRRTICCSESILRREVQPHRIPLQDTPSVGRRVLSRMFQHRGEGCWLLQQEHLLSATLSLFTAQEDIEAQITATQRTAASPATLKVTSGAPLSFFDPATWPACFVEFFYGDCAPNLDRPVKLGWRRLFRYLMNREELEYHLASDLEDPLIPGGRYKGPSQSRWNTPEFAAVFVDTVRKLEVLQSTKGFFAKHQQTFAQDLRLIAKATDKDFEQFQANLRASERGASVPALIVAAKQQKDAWRAKGLAAPFDAYHLCGHDGGQQDDHSSQGSGYELEIWPVLFFLYYQFCRHLQPLDGGVAPGRWGAFR